MTDATQTAIPHAAPDYIAMIKTMLGQSTVAFQRIFVDIAGGALPGLFLSQCWYWSQHTSDQQEWFYKTQEKWFAALGMTRTEQETARHNLRSAGILQEERRGIPARLYYRLDKKQLAAALETSISRNRQRDKFRERSRAGYVYVAHGNGLYKIGKSMRPIARVELMETKAPFPMHVCLLIPTDDMTHTEKVLHERFAAEHHRGEWYRLVPGHLQWIREHYAWQEPESVGL